MSRLFKCVRFALRPFLRVRDMVCAEPIGEEPVIFLANHLGAVGPMYMAGTFPLRDNVVIWCNEGMMDEELIVDYARHDWWWNPDGKLAPFYNATIPYIAKAIVPKVLRSAPTIAVCRDARVMTTMRKSIKALKEGRHIVIFPELPDGYNSHAEQLQMGWLNLVAMYQKATGKLIRMIPVYIDELEKMFRVGKGITADPDRPVAEQSADIEKQIAWWIRGGCKE